MSGAARALVLDLEALGVDAAPYLQEAGLTREEVFDPDRRLAVGLTEALWAAAAEHLTDPLRAAMRLPLGAYAVVDFVAAKSETVGAGLGRIAEYFPLVDPRVRMVVGQDVKGGVRPFFFLSLAMADGRPVPAFAQQFTFAAIVLRSRRFTGVDWPLLRVELTFERSENEAELEATFGCPIAFDRATARLVLEQSAFDLELPSAERELLPLLDQHAKGQLGNLGAADEPLASIHQALRSACAEGRPTLLAVAKRMGTSARSLQRRLDERKTSFTAELDLVRHRLAKAYLTERQLSIAEVAFILGFSDQPAFTRAFSRWEGTTPSAFRARALSG